ncbi:hypothetical protein [Actinomadura roseirufa]|nr:hypothetical protein [Actinomadura roseirufa]
MGGSSVGYSYYGPANNNGSLDYLCAQVGGSEGAVRQTEFVTYGDNCFGT